MTATASVSVPGFSNRTVRQFVRHQGNYETDLYSLVTDFQRGALIAPNHQRDFVWENSKRKAYIQRLINTSQSNELPLLIGVIVTYQLKDGDRVDGTVFLNDGLQRLSTAREFIETPQKYGVSLEVAEGVLSAQKVTVQHRHYRNHSEAWEDFLALNQGTALTPRDTFKGALTNMPDYSTVWGNTLRAMHVHVETQGRRVIDVKKGTTLKANAVAIRHDYALFYRFAMNVRTFIGTHETVTKTNVAMSNKSSTLRQPIEQLLANYIAGSNQNVVLSRFKYFHDFVTDVTNYLEMCVQAHRNNQRKIAEEQARQNGEPFHPETLEYTGVARGIAPTLYRWLLEVAIYAHVNGISAKTWQSAFAAILNHTNGYGYVTYVNEEGRSLTLTIGPDRSRNFIKAARVCGVDTTMWEK